MKARLILWLLQALLSPRGRSTLAAVLILLLVPLVLLASIIPVTIPLVSDEQMQMYRQVSATMPVAVDWRPMVAVDAVKNRQDFSQVDVAAVTLSALAFVGTETQTHLDNQVIDFEASVVGAWYQYDFTLPDGGEAWWDADQVQGQVKITLLDIKGKPVSAGKLDPGAYKLRLEVVQAPAEYQVTLFTRTEKETHYAKTPEQVMAELGFTVDEMALAHVYMKTLADVA